MPITMQPSQWLFDFLKSYEKFRPTAYAATKAEYAKGIWTLGWGHTKNVKEGDTCTRDQAEQWLHADVAEAVHNICQAVTVKLAQAQFDAVISLTFNAGYGKRDGKKGDIADSTLLAKLNAGDFAGAAAEFPKWDKQAGKEVPGLLTRRLAEQAHFIGTAG
jgi:lysozyme